MHHGFELANRSLARLSCPIFLFTLTVSSCIFRSKVAVIGFLFVLFQPCATVIGMPTSPNVVIKYVSEGAADPASALSFANEAARVMRAIFIYLVSRDVSRVALIMNSKYIKYY